jgi:hypothetical protein
MCKTAGYLVVAVEIFEAVASELVVELHTISPVH